MRRQDRRITEKEAYAILKREEYGLLSTVTSRNEPYGVPVNYYAGDECLYFHCALEGDKISNIDNNPKVSFCVVGKTEVLPDKFGTKYESCIVQGLASESFGEEKELALEGLIHKYSEDYLSQGMRYIDEMRDKSRVFKISIESISGKARK